MLFLHLSLSLSNWKSICLERAYFEYQPGCTSRTMAELRATEMWYGRQSNPADYVDTAAAPVSYERVPSLGLAPYDMPPRSPYERGNMYAPVQYTGLPYDFVHARVAPVYEPLDGVIPGVQHPDGRFEPHPHFARKPAPEPEEPIKHVVELAVPVCCEACEERVTNYIGKAAGVDTVECDLDAQTVKVTGDVAPADVLQRCKKCFRKSALISN